MAERIEKVKKKKARRGYFDFSLLAMLIFLIFFGLIMIYSASSYVAARDYEDGATHFLVRQAEAIGVGAVLMIIATFFPMDWIFKINEWIYVVSYASLFMVLSPLGVKSHEAARWFRIPGVPFNIQPAELVKLAIIISIAVAFTKMGDLIDTWKGCLFIVGITIIPALTILFVTRNLSSALIVCGIVAAMYFVASKKILPFVSMGGMAVALYFGTLTYFNSLDFGGFNSFRLERIAAWVDPSSQTSDVAYQVIKGLYAIGSGGFWGKGFGASIQKQGFIPEAQNDMIFTIICEELGIVVAIALIFLYAVMLWRIQQIASASQDSFCSYVAIGVMAHIAIQVVLNIAVVTNVIPNTGVTLPFVSYGGTSVVLLMTEMGLVFNVSRRAVFKEDEE